MDFDYQLRAAELAIAGGVKHYLLVSSSMAHAESKNFYLGLKGQLEQEIQKLPFQRISIFRPSVLIGERNHAPHALFERDDLFR